MTQDKAASRRFRAVLMWERVKLTISEGWRTFRCDTLNRCPGCNVCESGRSD